MGRYRLGKVILSAYEEISYYQLCLRDGEHVLQTAPLASGAFLNRRVRVLQAEKETGIFHPEDGGDLVERWLPCEEIHYLHTHHVLTGKQQIYKYDQAKNEFIAMPESEQNMASAEILLECKKLETLRTFRGSPRRIVDRLKNVSGPDFWLTTHEEAEDMDDEQGVNNGFSLAKIDYIPTRDKVFYYTQQGDWVPLETEKIFYQLNVWRDREGWIHSRQAYSYLPLKIGTYVKVLCNKYNNSTISRTDFQEDVTVEECYFKYDSNFKAYQYDFWLFRECFEDYFLLDDDAWRDKTLQLYRAKTDRKPLLRISDLFVELEGE